MSAEVLEGFRLSPQQRAAWRGVLADRLPAARCSVSIDGELDAALLLRAIDEAWKRHEVLRTYFPTLPGMSEPLQVIADPQPVAVRREAAAPDAIAGREPLRFRSKISEGPVCAVELVEISPSRHMLRLALPALCADGRTLELLARDIARLYGAARQAAEVPPAPVQYADLAQWLNDLLESDMSAAGQTYWKPFLADASPLIELPFERGRQGLEYGQTESRAFTLSAALAGTLAETAERIGCSPPAVVLAALAATLSRYTDRSEFLLARGSDGRRLEELQDALGPLSRWLPLRCEMAEAETFEGLAKDLGRRLADQELWQEYLSSDDGTASGAGPGGSWSPIAFEFRDLPEPFTAGGAAFSVRAIDVESPAFAMRVACTRAMDSLSVALHCDSGRFGAAEIEDFAGALRTVLEAGLAAPATPVARLPILTEEHRHRLLETFNESAGSAPADVPLHRLFERQARERPEAVALAGEGRRLTFGEADALAEGIARRLAALGVGPDSVVGILLERSVESVVAILAVWKAGGAYLPIEISTPPERRTFMLQDAAARALVTTRVLAQTSSEWPCATLALEDAGAGESGSARGGALPDAAPENLAYVIYTSGSTGQPKGVAIEHRQLSNYVAAIVGQLRPPAGAGFATVSTFAADLGHTAIFPSLVTGGTLHVISQDRATDADALSDYVSGNAIDYLKIVPSHLSALLTGSRPEGVIPARALILGGEALSWELVAQVRGLAPRCEIVNHYGPTETTVGATTFRIAQGETLDAISRTVPIGRPIANARAYILDCFRQPVPVWAPGELSIGGDGVARGYQQRPELTAERFVEDPFRPGARMYRTGDVARYLPDGAIEWLGRADHQVKVRGFRVELGEIEARLRERPGIVESVVLLREDAPGDKRLVAYVVSSGPEAGGESDVKDFLRSTLPEFMVPASVVFLKRLPLTPNGKIDRRALPAPETGARDGNQGATAPRNPVEQALASIWQQVLRLDALGVHDNFFHLGGDSILAIQIVARANRAGLRLTPRQLFQNQTVAELAGVVDASTAPGLEEASAAGLVPLTPIESWFFEQDLTDVEHYNQAILLETPAALDVAALKEAVAAIVSHHDALRLRFRKDGSGWHQELPAADADDVFSSVVLDASDPSALSSAATGIQSALNLERGPLARFVLFDRGPGERRLLIAIHHLAVDGVSWGVILEDLETAYGQRTSGAPIALPPRTTSFAGWARRLAAHARSSALDGELEYWTLPARSRAARLPVDFNGSNSVETEGVVEMALTAEETAALLRDVPAAYGTQINDALLTALLRATEGWTSADSLLVDLEGHGREDILEGANLSRTVGWFTTRFPVVLSGGGRSDLAEVLKHVKEQLRAVPQRGIGYGLLRYSGGKPEVAKQLRELPQPEISFNYLGQLDSRYSDRSLFRPAAGSVGLTRSRRQKRRYLISLDGSIRDGRVAFSWSFSEAVHRRETIESLARRFTEALRDLIAHCVAPDAGGYTPSDFPKAKLSQRGLDKLLSRFGAAEDKS